LRCEFCDATTENEFLRHHLAMTQGQLRVTFLFCALFYLCFAATDLIWVGYSLTTCLLVGARMAVAAVVLTCLVLLKRRPTRSHSRGWRPASSKWPARPASC
jgi:membrane associated rhomboid family serine protease